MIYYDKLHDYVVSRFIDTGIIREHDNLVVALSGGIDSMCLFDVFYKLSDEFHYKLSVLHVEHGIRGMEARRDLEFVQKYCKSFNVKLNIIRVNALEYSKKSKTSVEEAARILRYKAFKDAIDSYKGERNYMLVAHHKRDQVETIIHNIARGTGIKGLVGMEEVNGKILRPLLFVKKSDIESYVKEHDIPYVNDSTNLDNKYKRNYIRNVVLPSFEMINSNALEHVIELSRIAKDYSDYMFAVSKYAYGNIVISEEGKNIKFDLNKFLSLNDVIKTELIRLALSKLVFTIKDIGKVHIDDIITLAKKEKGGHLDLPYNITIDKKKNQLTFTQNKYNISMSRRKTNGL